jgi:hypothetical protein
MLAYSINSNVGISEMRSGIEYSDVAMMMRQLSPPYCPLIAITLLPTWSIDRWEHTTCIGEKGLLELFRHVYHVSTCDMV